MTRYLVTPFAHRSFKPEFSSSIWQSSTGMCSIGRIAPKECLRHFSPIRVVPALAAVTAVACFAVGAVRAKGYYSDEELSLHGHIYSAVSGDTSAELQGG